MMEVGGDAAVYCPVGQVEQWVAAVAKIVSNPHEAPSRDVRLRQASKYSWTEYARIICDAYRKLAT